MNGSIGYSTWQQLVELEDHRNAVRTITLSHNDCLLASKYIMGSHRVSWISSPTSKSVYNSSMKTPLRCAAFPADGICKTKRIRVGHWHYPKRTSPRRPSAHSRRERKIIAHSSILLNLLFRFNMCHPMTLQLILFRLHQNPIDKHPQQCREQPVKRQRCVRNKSSSIIRI